MARHAQHLHAVATESCNRDVTDDILNPSGYSIQQYYIEKWRDAIQDKFSTNSVLDDSTGYTVSDIWERNHGGNIFSYGFFVRDNANDCEWAFVLGGHDDSPIPPDIDDIVVGSTGTVYEDRVRKIGASSPANSSTNQNGVIIFFNPDIATYSAATTDIGFDDTTALTFTGGDFTAITFDYETTGGTDKMRGNSVNNPYVMDTTVYSASSFQRRCAVCFEDVEGSMAFYIESGWGTDDARGAWCVFSKTGLNLNNSSDPTSWFVTSGWFGGNGKTAGNYAYAQDASGVLQTYTLAKPGEFNYHDHIIEESSGDQPDYRYLRLEDGTNGAGTKGAVKKEIMVIVGPANQGEIGKPHKFDTDDPSDTAVVKFSSDVAFFWEDGYSKIFDHYPSTLETSIPVFT